MLYKYNLFIIEAPPQFLDNCLSRFLLFCNNNARLKYIHNYAFMFSSFEIYIYCGLICYMIICIYLLYQNLVFQISYRMFDIWSLELPSNHIIKYNRNVYYNFLLAWPDFKVFHTNSFSCSSVTSEPNSFWSLVSHTKTSWKYSTTMRDQTQNKKFDF